MLVIMEHGLPVSMHGLHADDENDISPATSPSPITLGPSSAISGSLSSS